MRCVPLSILLRVNSFLTLCAKRDVRIYIQIQTLTVPELSGRQNGDEEIHGATLADRGESHGEALVGIIEGVPAGVELTSKMVRDALARRRLGYGRGARMKFEEDKVRILGGVRHGLTQGGPVALEIANTEWPKWVDVMSSDPVDPALIEGRARNAALTRPRPGHADFTGMQKYNFAEARPVLERASARETATRVALGVVAAQVLKHSVLSLYRILLQWAAYMRPMEHRCLLPVMLQLLMLILFGASIKLLQMLWSPGLMRRTKMEKHSAVSSRFWLMVCPQDSGHMCIGIVVWMPALPRP